MCCWAWLAGHGESHLTGGFGTARVPDAFSQLKDTLGSTIALTDASGNVTTSYTYDPFGGTSASGAANANVFQYTGRENEGNGIYYYRARYYSPFLGRFVSEDPAGFSASFNFYAYTLDDPASFSDPSGMDVVVVTYEGLNSNSYGHIGIGVNTNQTTGLYPADESNLALADLLLSNNLPATVKPDDGHTPTQILVIPTSPEQDAAIQNWLNNIQQNPGLYNLYGRNCANFVDEALDAGGVPHSSHFIATPANVMNDLNNRYGPQAQSQQQQQQLVNSGGLLGLAQGLGGH